MLAERLGLELPFAALQRIAAATLGNPLFALQLARVVGPVGDRLPVPAAVEELLGVRVAALPDEVRWLLLAVALDGDLHPEQLEALGSDVRAALRSGLLVIDGDRVRAGHPLLAAAARAGALPSERRAVHALLADVVDEPERRALHLALARAARRGAGGARGAGGGERRGARRAPGGGRARRAGVAADPARGRCGRNACSRWRATSSRRASGGACTTCSRPCWTSCRPARRASGRWLLLSESGVDTHGDGIAYIERALEAAGDDPALHGRVLALKALCTVAEGVERIPEAEAGR